MELTLEQAVYNHRKLWRGIIDEIREHECRYSSARVLKDTVRARLFPEMGRLGLSNGCFLCEFARYQNHHRQLCSLCPCMVINEGRRQVCLDGLYEKFRGAYGRQETETALKAAEKIAGLPVINPIYLKDGEEDEDDA